MKFNSQICTTREQSERLLALGLKRETADMVYRSFGYIIDEFGNKERRFKQPTLVVDGWESKYDIPAWSLHRIISMVYSSRAKKNGLGLAIIEYENPFEDMIRQIEWLINGGYFNKEYLDGND